MVTLRRLKMNFKTITVLDRSAFVSRRGGGGRGDSHIERAGMLVGNFRLNP